MHESFSEILLADYNISSWVFAYYTKKPVLMHRSMNHHREERASPSPVCTWDWKLPTSPWTAYPVLITWPASFSDMTCVTMGKSKYLINETHLPKLECLHDFFAWYVSWHPGECNHVAGLLGLGHLSIKICPILPSWMGTRSMETFPVREKLQEMGEARAPAVWKTGLFSGKDGGESTFSFGSNFSLNSEFCCLHRAS